MGGAGLGAFVRELLRYEDRINGASSGSPTGSDVDTGDQPPLPEIIDDLGRAIPDMSESAWPEERVRRLVTDPRAFVINQP